MHPKSSPIKPPTPTVVGPPVLRVTCSFGLAANPIVTEFPNGQELLAHGFAQRQMEADPRITRVFVQRVEVLGVYCRSDGE